VGRVPGQEDAAAAHPVGDLPRSPPPSATTSAAGPAAGPAVSAAIFCPSTVNSMVPRCPAIARLLALAHQDLRVTLGNICDNNKIMAVVPTG